MPYVMKPNKLFAKDPNGDGYLPQNIITDRTTTDMVAEVNAAGETQIAAVQKKGAETLDSIPDDYTALSNEVVDLKSATESLDDEIFNTIGARAIHVTSLNGYTPVNGNIGSNGTWNNISESYQHVYIPIPRTGGTLSVKAGTNAGYFGVVKSYATPVNGAAIDYSAESDYTNRISISGTVQRNYTLPNDAKGLIILIKNNGNDCIPSVFDLEIPAVSGTLTEQVTEIDSRVSFLEIGPSYYNRDDLSWLTPVNGNIGSNGTWNNISDSYQHVVVPATGGMTLTVTANASETMYFAVLKSYTTPVNGATIDYSSADGFTSNITKAAGQTYTGILPDDAKYVIVLVLRNNVDVSPSAFALHYNAPEETRIKWIAMGDSITEGYYSKYGDAEDTEGSKSPSGCYAAICAKIKNFDLDNAGIGGCGWLKRGTQASPKLNLREQIDATENDEYVIDFTQYDVLTVMCGVNDWKGGMNLGSFSDGLNPVTESVYANMRYFIETVQARNPALKIIFVSPVNCRMQYGSVPSTANNNWAIGYQWHNTNDTLEDYYDAMKTVCEYYGIQLVDMLHESVINRVNAVNMLPDKTHPSLDAHRQMGIELAGKMQYS